MQQWEDDGGGGRRRIARTDGSGQTKMDERWRRRGNAKKIRAERKRERERDGSWMEKNYTREAEGGERERERECAKSTNLLLFSISVLQLSVYLSVFLLSLSFYILSCLCPSHPPPFSSPPVYAERRDCRYYGGVRIVTLIN